MDIHVPRKAITSLKDLLRELAIITAGILIALGFDGLVQWRHHQQLVKEARANIIDELRENQQELAKEMQQLATVEQQGETLVKLVHQLELNPRTAIHEVDYGFSLAELHSTSWNSATTTGALSYMPYAEVKKYTEVYDLQRAFDAVQQRALTGSLDMEGLFTLLGREPGTLTKSELFDAERRIGIAVANVRAMQQVAEPLNQRYQATLKESSN